MADPQPTLYVLQAVACSRCQGRGYLLGAGYAPVCPDCRATGSREERVTLAEALRTDPETRAPLRAIFAEVSRLVQGSLF